jgi:hypothetical protein
MIGTMAKPTTTKSRSKVLVYAGLAGLLGSVLIGCEEAQSPPMATPTTLVAVPPASPSSAYVEPLDRPDEQAFTRDAHINYLRPWLTDNERLQVAADLCAAWRKGATYDQVRGIMDDTLTGWSETDKDLIVVLAAKDLCHEYVGTYGA